MGGTTHTYKYMYPVLQVPNRTLLMSACALQNGVHVHLKVYLGTTHNLAP